MQEVQEKIKRKRVTLMRAVRDAVKRLYKRSVFIAESLNARIATGALL